MFRSDSAAGIDVAFAVSERVINAANRKAVRRVIREFFIKNLLGG
ncbi:ribonuclease P protein component [Desulfovibrio sp. SGI.169]